jgi:hypothetical protein
MLYMFRAVFAPIIRSSKTVHGIGYVPGLLAATAELGLQLTHASGSSKRAWHIPDAVSAVFELLMMGRKTARNM